MEPVWRLVEHLRKEREKDSRSSREASRRARELRARSRLIVAEMAEEHKTKRAALDALGKASEAALEKGSTGDFGEALDRIVEITLSPSIAIARSLSENVCDKADKNVRQETVDAEFVDLEERGGS